MSSLIIVWIGVTKYDLNLSWLLVGTNYLSSHYNSWRPLNRYMLLQRYFDLLVVETNVYKFDVVKMTEEKKLMEWSIFIFKICIYLAVRFFYFWYSKSRQEQKTRNSMRYLPPSEYHQLVISLMNNTWLRWK